MYGDLLFADIPTYPTPQWKPWCPEDTLWSKETANEEQYVKIVPTYNVWDKVTPNKLAGSDCQSPANLKR